LTSARVELDSVNPDGTRLTTMVLRLPRCLLAQLNKHRAFSSSAMSMRAVPTRKLLRQALLRPFTPSWTANRPGMSGRPLGGLRAVAAACVWRAASALCCLVSLALWAIGVHKQNANRALEPFLYVDVVVSGTEWENFFALRCEDRAQPEMRELALAMLEAYRASEPRQLEWGEWHAPFAEGLPDADALSVSAARCARASYASHDGGFSVEKDRGLEARLLSWGDMVPFEHQAMAVRGLPGSGNFGPGWLQRRKTMSGERRSFPL